MTDYRDPNYHDSNYRDPNLPPGAEPWSNSTWGWIAGVAVVMLVLVFIFSSGTDTTRTANEPANPPATVGQRSLPPAPPAGPKSEAPTMNRPAPAPMTSPAPVTPAPTQPQP
jgi:hypothetical protein